MSRKCKIPACKQRSTKPCDGCGKPICPHHSSGWMAGTPWCRKCRNEQEARHARS